MSRADGEVHVGGLRLRHLEVRLLGRRVDDVEDGIRTRFDPLTADEESVGIAQRDNGFGGHTHIVDSCF